MTPIRQKIRSAAARLGFDHKYPWGYKSQKSKDDHQERALGLKKYANNKRQELGLLEKRIQNLNAKCRNRMHPKSSSGKDGKPERTPQQRTHIRCLFQPTFGTGDARQRKRTELAGTCWRMETRYGLIPKSGRL